MHVLSMSYSIKAPAAAIAVPAAETADRVVMNAEQCVIDGREFYLRGRVPVPVHGLDEPFIWGVWAELSPKTFLRVHELWNTEGREAEPPFRAYLNSQLAVYGDTLNLELEVRTQPVGRRPHYFVVDAEHPLAVEQREGISLERLQEIAVAMAHPR